jgi:hypothetical protein
MHAEGFHGALQEFVEARNDLSAGDLKGSIVNAHKAYESVMKTILGRSSGDADDLIRGLEKQGFFHDIPASFLPPFKQKILNSVPILRNTLAGHGQGAVVIEIPPDVAELCLHLSASLIVFLLRRQLKRAPKQAPPDNDSLQQISEDDVPF